MRPTAEIEIAGVESSDDNKITPHDYVCYALEFGMGGRAMASVPIVTGDVDLTCKGAGQAVKSLPEAEILGTLLADGGSSLQIIGACTVHGKCRLDQSPVRSISPSSSFRATLSARGCKNLKSIAGKCLGDVFLERSGLRFADDQFFCKGNFSVEGCSELEELDCVVEGSVDAGYSGLKRLGTNFRAGKNLFLSSCRSLKQIGFVGEPEHVSLDGSGVTRILPDFRCTKSLTLTDCQCLREIPDISTEELILSGSPISRLVALNVSDYLSVENCVSLANVESNPQTKVHIRGCGVTSLDGVGAGSKFVEVTHCGALKTIGGRRSGSLHLRNLPGLVGISGDFRCGGDLKISQCDALRQLCGTVGGDAELLDLGALSRLGPDFSVRGGLSISCREWSGGTEAGLVLGCSVGGKLNAQYSNVRELERDFRVGGDIVLYHCERIIRARGWVGGSAWFTESSIEILGADFECDGTLCIIGCHNLKTLNCAVGGKTVVISDSLEKTGPGFHCGKDVEFGGCRRLRKVDGTVGGDVRVDTAGVTVVCRRKPSPAGAARV